MEQLIKYIENKIKVLKQCQQESLKMEYKESAEKFGLRISSYQDILERLKSGKYD